VTKPSPSSATTTTTIKRRERFIIEAQWKRTWSSHSEFEVSAVLLASRRCIIESPLFTFSERCSIEWEYWKMTEKEYWKMAGKVATRMKPSDAKTNSEI
jgi:hypothetical protein